MISIRNCLRFWWIAAFIVKIILSSFTPLAPDEAYYWFWSFHPDFSYFDHPPMIAWIFRIGRILADFPNGVRIPGILIGHLAFGIWLLISHDLFGSRFTKKFFWIYLALPFLGVGSLIHTPDLPLTFFWALSTYLFLEWERSASLALSAALGLSLGLGFSSKYHMVLLPISLLIYSIQSPYGPKIKLNSLVLIFLFGLVGAAPVIYWNSQNNWGSFLFQINHGLGKSTWQPHWTSDYLLGQFILVTPGIWFLFFKGYRYAKLRLFFWSAFFPWAFFFVSSFRGAVQANWPICSLAPALLLALVSAQSKLHLRAFIGVWSVATLIVVSIWLYPWMDAAPPKLLEVHNIRKTISEVQSYQPLFGGSYQIASVFSYYSGKLTYKLTEMSRKDQFDYWPESSPVDRIFFVLRDKLEPLPAWVEKARGQTQVVIDLDQYELVKVAL